ncbi:Bax inhibitor-1/YccA family protein [Derxia gummosa]|uniref:Bax inhibitor-1/YccA family protein n=1 Tax=Derxia gummosa DSM 723 TaxID=1121388 RepID=A0A8B6X557_9BURK|nr:Bax inhibitor-1/YccA family protein [Derxia gummosa]
MDTRNSNVTTLEARPWYGGEAVTPERANKTLRQTYALLGANLAWSAAIAGTVTAMGIPGPGLILTLIGFYGLLFAIMKFRNSGAGVGLTFALTGFMGWTLGPLLSHTLKMPGGAEVIAMSLGATAIIFFGMSAVGLTTKRDLSSMGKMLFAGMIVAVLASLGAIFFNIPALALTVSAVVVLLMAGMIVFETNNIVRGGETNYVMATVSLFVSIFNLFSSLLHLLGFANSND